jgi:hypothetical protein
MFTRISIILQMNIQLSNNQIEALSVLSDTLPLNKFRELHDCVTLNRVIRFEIFLRDIHRISKWTDKLELNYSVSNNSYNFVQDNGMENWSSTVTPCSDNDPLAMRFVYFNFDKKKCEQAKRFDENEDDFNLGLLLKYPKCCVESYMNWQATGKKPDPISILTDSFKLGGQLQSFNLPNPFTRYINFGLHSHFPCSCHCEETKSNSYASLRVMTLNFPEIAKKFIASEKSLVLFSDGRGVCLWNNFRFSKNHIYIDSVHLKGKGQLLNTFNLIDEIELTPVNLILYSNFTRIDHISTDKLFLGSFNWNTDEEFNKFKEESLFSTYLHRYQN